MKQASDLDLAIRTYRDEDEDEVLALLRASLGEGPGGERSPEFFRWKHLRNPFGRSFMLLGISEGRIVGFRSLMRWRFTTAGSPVEAVRAVDTATHPDHQRRGIFSTLTREAVRRLTGEADVWFNTPNRKSMPGYLKMGWIPVGTIPIRVRPRRPVRVALGLRDLEGGTDAVGERPPVTAPTAAELLADTDLASLLELEPPSPGLRTARSPAYFRWRYGEAPLLDYRAQVERDGGGVRGLVVFRVRPRGRLWETAIVELLAAPGDGRTVRRLLRSAVRAAPADHLTLCPSSLSSLRAVRAAGFLPSPRGVQLVVRPLRQGIDPDPTVLGSWRFTLGDVEVF